MSPYVDAAHLLLPHLPEPQRSEFAGLIELVRAAELEVCRRWCEEIPW